MSKSRPTQSMWVLETQFCPVCSAVGMTKGDVDAGNFFVLQDVADDAGAGGVGADRKFADAVAVFVGAGVGAKFLEQFLVLAGQGMDAVLFHFDR